MGKEKKGDGNVVVKNRKRGVGRMSGVGLKIIIFMIDK